jgi:hypothetical protein
MRSMHMPLVNLNRPFGRSFPEISDKRPAAAVSEHPIIPIRKHHGKT